MTNNEILSKLATIKKGRYISLTKVKDCGNGVVKESDMVIRLGVNYANMKINENKQTGELPWGHWVPGLENLVIEHTKVDKKTKEAMTSYYLRVTSTDPAHPETGADVIATRYLLNGEVVDRQTISSLIDEKKLESKPSSVYSIKFENIIRLGGSNQ